MTAPIDAAHKTAGELVADLRHALADADPIAAILIIQQLEAACNIVFALDNLRGALESKK